LKYPKVIQAVITLHTRVNFTPRVNDVTG